MSELRDDDLVHRVLESRVVFRPRFEGHERESATAVWRGVFEGHLVAVVAEEGSDRTVLIIDGEPRGELTGWPPRWRRD